MKNLKKNIIGACLCLSMVFLLHACSSTDAASPSNNSTDNTNTTASQNTVVKSNTSTDAPVVAPNVKGKAYDEARKIILEAGWKVQEQEAPGEYDGAKKALWAKGYHEVESCSGAGDCNLIFENGKGKLLMVTVGGEDGTVSDAWVEEAK